MDVNEWGVTQRNAHLPSRAEGTVSCTKASEPQGNGAFTAPQSRPHSTSRLRDPVICLRVRFLAPGECESFRQLPCLTLSGSFTTFSAQLSGSAGGAFGLGSRVWLEA